MGKAREADNRGQSREGADQRDLPNTCVCAAMARMAPGILDPIASVRIPTGVAQKRSNADQHHERALADGPTAIVSGSDMLAAAGLQGLGEKGMRVRADAWVIGHDGTIGEILTAG